MPRRRILDPDEEDEDYKGGGGAGAAPMAAGPYDQDTLAQAQAAGVDGRPKRQRTGKRRSYAEPDSDDLDGDDDDEDEDEDEDEYGARKAAAPKKPKQPKAKKPAAAAAAAAQEEEEEEQYAAPVPSRLDGIISRRWVDPHEELRREQAERRRETHRWSQEDAELPVAASRRAMQQAGVLRDQRGAALSQLQQSQVLVQQWQQEAEQRASTLPAQKQQMEQQFAMQMQQQQSNLQQQLQVMAQQAQQTMPPDQAQAQIQQMHHQAEQQLQNINAAMQQQLQQQLQNIDASAHPPELDQARQREDALQKHLQSIDTQIARIEANLPAQQQAASEVASGSSSSSSSSAAAAGGQAPMDGSSGAAAGSGAGPGSPSRQDSGASDLAAMDEDDEVAQAMVMYPRGVRPRLLSGGTAPFWLYLVKLKGRSMQHCEWWTKEEIEGDKPPYGSARLRRFETRCGKLAEESGLPFVQDPIELQQHIDLTRAKAKDAAYEARFRRWEREVQEKLMPGASEPSEEQLEEGRRLARAAGEAASNDAVDPILETALASVPESTELEDHVEGGEGLQPECVWAIEPLSCPGVIPRAGAHGGLAAWEDEEKSRQQEEEDRVSGGRVKTAAQIAAAAARTARPAPAPYSYLPPLPPATDTDHLQAIEQRCMELTMLDLLDAIERTRVGGQPAGFPFMQPVDPELDGVPQYHELIDKHLEASDLGTIRARLEGRTKTYEGVPLQPWIPKGVSVEEARAIAKEDAGMDWSPPPGVAPKGPRNHLAEQAAARLPPLGSCSEVRYPSARAVALDLAWVWRCARRFNAEPENDVRVMAEALATEFRRQWARVQRRLGVVGGRFADMFPPGGPRRVLVRWKGVPPAEATWEREEELGEDDLVSECASVQARQTWGPRPRRRQYPAGAGAQTVYSQSLDYGSGRQLRGYQVEGLNWLIYCWRNRRGCLLADEMGLGKTAQTVAFLRHLKERENDEGPFLVVAPLSTIQHWQREVKAWSDFRPCIYHSTLKGGNSRRLLRRYEVYFNPEDADNPRAVGSTERLKFDVMITTYETCIADELQLGRIPWSVIVVDEGQRLKNRQNKLTGTLARLCGDEPWGKGGTGYGFGSGQIIPPKALLPDGQGPQRLLLTGTPLQNTTEELWALLHFVQPVGSAFESRDEFMERFGELRTQEQVEGLAAAMRPHVLRRLKEDVEKSIPKKKETLVQVEMTMLQKKYYLAVLKRNRGWLVGQGAKAQEEDDGGSSGQPGKRGRKKGAGRGTGKAAAVPALLNIESELRKVCNHPYLVKGAREREEGWTDEEELEPDDVRAALVQKRAKEMVRASGKMILLSKLLPKLQQDGHRVLLFSQMTKMLDLIEEWASGPVSKGGMGWGVERIDGSVRGNARQAAIDRFQGVYKGARAPLPGQEPFLFLLSTRAGGVGLTLTKADTVIIFDSDWNPQNDVQAMARAHRIGQKREVSIYRLLTARTYEASMFQRASRKLGLEQAVMGGGGWGGSEGGQGGAPVNFRPQSRKEVEELLREGAYGALMEGEEEAQRRTTAFEESSLEDVMRTAATVIEEGGTAAAADAAAATGSSASASSSGGAAAGGEDGASLPSFFRTSQQVSRGAMNFSKTTFTLGKDAEEEGEKKVQIDDPSFWDKVLGGNQQSSLLHRLESAKRTRPGPDGSGGPEPAEVTHSETTREAFLQEVGAAAQELIDSRLDGAEDPVWGPQVRACLLKIQGLKWRRTRKRRKKGADEAGVQEDDEDEEDEEGGGASTAAAASSSSTSASSGPQSTFIFSADQRERSATLLRELDRPTRRARQARSDAPGNNGGGGGAEGEGLEGEDGAAPGWSVSEGADEDWRADGAEPKKGKKKKGIEPGAGAGRGRGRGRGRGGKSGGKSPGKGRGRGSLRALIAAYEDSQDDAEEDIPVLWWMAGREALKDVKRLGLPGLKVGAGGSSARIAATRRDKDRAEKKLARQKASSPIGGSASSFSSSSSSSSSTSSGAKGSKGSAKTASRSSRASASAATTEPAEPARPTIHRKSPAGAGSKRSRQDQDRDDSSTQSGKASAGGAGTGAASPPGQPSSAGSGPSSNGSGAGGSPNAKRPRVDEAAMAREQEARQQQVLEEQQRQAALAERQQQEMQARAVAMQQQQQQQQLMMMQQQQQQAQHQQQLMMQQQMMGGQMPPGYQGGYPPQGGPHGGAPPGYQ